MLSSSTSPARHMPLAKRSTDLPGSLWPASPSVEPSLRCLFRPDPDEELARRVEALRARELRERALDLGPGLLLFGGHRSGAENTIAANRPPGFRTRRMPVNACR